MADVRWKEQKKRQRRRIVGFSRFDVANASGGTWSYGGSADALTLTVNKAVLFHGVRLFGDANGSQYEVKFTVKDENVTGTYTSERDKDSVCGYDVMLPKPVSLQPDEEFMIIATIKGPKSHKGCKGKSSVKVEDMVVTVNNGTSANSTSKTGGQFYKIFLSKL